jgi:hypothetical protein
MERNSPNGRLLCLTVGEVQTFLVLLYNSPSGKLKRGQQDFLSPPFRATGLHTGEP